MNLKKLLLLSCVVIILGAIATFFYRRNNILGMDKWSQIEFRQNIPFTFRCGECNLTGPRIVKISGEGKFVSRQEGNLFVYRLEFKIPEMDSSTSNCVKKHEDIIKNNTPAFDVEDFESYPIDSTTIVMTYSFTFLDKDGFRIEEIESDINGGWFCNKMESQELIQITISLKTSDSIKSILGRIMR